MSWASMFGWILLPQVGGILGGIATATQIKTWYEVRLSIEDNFCNLWIYLIETFKTIMASTKCNFWSCLDNTLFIYGYCFVFSCSWRWRIIQNTCINILFYTIISQLVMVTNIFSFSSIRSCKSKRNLIINKTNENILRH